ncbi:MAG: hypothetical protein FJ137_19980 [Deltaproteobacteria bacterium]|nr:hypothetical protein [Deltaproteobacteria bacterium]
MIFAKRATTVTACRVACDETHDESVHVGGNGGFADAWRLRILGALARCQRQGLGTGERRSADNHLVQDDAEAVEVGASLVGASPLELSGAV